MRWVGTGAGSATGQARVGWANHGSPGDVPAGLDSDESSTVSYPLGIGPGGARLGKLGLAGFSAGGLPLWQALAANLGRVSEVFAFDARGIAKSEATLLRWYSGDASRRLRMTGGHQLDANAAIQRRLAGNAETARVSTLPPDKSGYLPGVSPRWDHVCSSLEESEKDAYLNADWVWHQFAVFGGLPVGGEPSAATFLQRFLEESDL